MAWTPDQDYAYLQANPDVRAAVMQGQFGSGQEHYNQYGLNETRAGVPAMQTPMPQEGLSGGMQKRPMPELGGAFGGTSPIAPQPMTGGSAPGMANSLAQPFGEQNAAGAFSSIGDYLRQDPTIAQGFASGALNSSDVINQQPGAFSLSPRIAELQRQSIENQQRGNIENRLRSVDSRYDIWKNSSDPRDQRNLRDLINQQAAQGWSYDQMYSPQASYNQWVQTQQSQANGQLPAAPGLFGGSGAQGMANYQQPRPQPQTGSFGGFGGMMPRYPRTQTGAFGGSQFGSFQRQPGQNMQPTFDAMGRGSQGASPMGQFQGGFMGFNQQQPNQGAFGGNQTGFLR